MEVVTALANVEVPGNETMGSVSVEASDRADSDRASKWARKKEKNVMLSLWREGPLYCGVRGGIMCTCGKSAHDSGGVLFCGIRHRLL